MKYEIIKLSESHASYKNEVADSEYIGQIPGVCSGWSFEYINKNGEYEYGSVSWEHLTPEEYANLWTAQDGGSWLHETPRWNGWEPTGRVVFRGYATDYYDPEEHEWFVEPYDPAKELAYIAGYVD